LRVLAAVASEGNSAIAKSELPERVVAEEALAHCLVAWLERERLDHKEQRQRGRQLKIFARERARKRHCGWVPPTVASNQAGYAVVSSEGAHQSRTGDVSIVAPSCATQPLLYVQNSTVKRQDSTQYGRAWKT